jgi:hypothetical protein
LQNAQIKGTAVAKTLLMTCGAGCKPNPVERIVETGFI